MRVYCLAIKTVSFCSGLSQKKHECVIKLNKLEMNKKANRNIPTPYANLRAMQRIIQKYLKYHLQTCFIRPTIKNGFKQILILKRSFTKPYKLVLQNYK